MYIPAISAYPATGWPYAAQPTSPQWQPIVPQQLQQLQQLVQIQQQQLQQLLQIVPAQLQQIQQLVQLVPQQVQQLLHVVAQQQFGAGQGVLGGGLGYVSPGFGVPLQTAPSFTAPFAATGHVM